MRHKTLLQLRLSVALGLIFSVLERTPIEPRQHRHRFEVQTLALDQGQVQFGAMGSGENVVLLAGRGGDACEQYLALGNALVAAGYRAVAVNLRGVGESRGSLERLNLHDLASDVAGLVDYLDERVHVVGRAFGNRVARCFAADHPSLVQSLSLIAAGGYYPPTPPNQQQQHKRPTQGLHLWREAGRAHEHAAQTTPLDQWWSGGSAQMLVLQGLDDRIAVPQNGRKLRDDFPERVTLREFENAGHALLFEQALPVAAAIIEFLNQFSRAP